MNLEQKKHIFYTKGPGSHVLDCTITVINDMQVMIFWLNIITQSFNLPSKFFASMLETSHSKLRDPKKCDVKV